MVLPRARGVEAMRWKVVNQLDRKLFMTIKAAIRNGEVEKRFRELGKGTCATVYAINDELVLKVNDKVESECVRDHQALKSLQGLPFVPTLYAYTTDGKYLIIERIKGYTLIDLNVVKIRFNRNVLLEQMKQFVEGCFKRGWIPNDIHEGNVMVSPRGFFIVDFGFFRRKHEEQDPMSSFSVGYELSYLEDLIWMVSHDGETTITELAEAV
jgi:Mn2+-dependent serine/threonine protein kinase